MNPPRNLLDEIYFPVSWGDMDALGHVNNTVYFRYFENIRTEWLRKQGCQITLNGASRGPVAVDAYCQFLLPVVYPADLKLTMLGGEPGRSSFETYYELQDANRSDCIYSKGTSRIVWVDYEKGSSIPLPKEIRELLPPAS